MISRLTLCAVTFAVLAATTLALATNASHRDVSAAAAAAAAAATAQPMQVIQLERVLVIGRRVASTAR